MLSLEKLTSNTLAGPHWDTSMSASAMSYADDINHRGLKVNNGTEQRIDIGLDGKSFETKLNAKNKPIKRISL